MWNSRIQEAEPIAACEQARGASRQFNADLVRSVLAASASGHWAKAAEDTQRPGIMNVIPT